MSQWRAGVNSWRTLDKQLLKKAVFFTGTPKLLFRTFYNLLLLFEFVSPPVSVPR